MKVSKQQHEPKNYHFEITEDLSMHVADFISISSLAHVFQPHFAGSFHICQNLA